MKKAGYILCLCALCALAYHEIRESFFSGESAQETAVCVPSGQLLTQMKNENQKIGDSEKKDSPDKKTKKVAYLTFDDGPSDNTKKVLETLREKDAVATFFLVGQEITPEREQILKDMLAGGNAIGVHTYSHEQNEMYGSEELFFEDYKKAESAIEKATGQKPVLHRFPWGSNNRYISGFVDRLLERLKGMGVRSFDWNVSGEDSIGAHVPAGTIFQNVQKDVTRYDEPIILLHDSMAMDHTAAVLGEIIDYIREQGYEFDTLDHREDYMFPASWR